MSNLGLSICVSGYDTENIKQALNRTENGLQLHIGTGSGASPVGIEGFREFEADLSALFLLATE